MNALRSACAPAAGVRLAPAIAVRRVLASGSTYCCHCATPPKASSSYPLRRATPYVPFTGLRRYAEMVYKRKSGNGSASGGVSIDHPHASPVDGVTVGIFSEERKGGRKFHGVCSGLKGDERRGQDSPGREPNHSTLWAFSEDSGNEEVTDAPFMDAVVKVYCTYTEPNFSLPWQKKRQYSSTGSGFMCAGRRVLTNAHCVQHHTQVKLKRRGDDTKFVAQVLAIGHECDIALLSVEDESFWKGVEPLKFGSLPRLQDAVVVVGYPIGGDTISVTSGVVSRIEVTSYTHGSSELLGVQIDAAINPGNSGGPAFNNGGECVGIAFQSLKSDDAENIGYIVPTPVIYHFLSDYEQNGKYTGFPILGVQWQRLENPALRKSLGMSTSMKGVMVRRIEPTSYAFNILQVNDIIMSFDGTPVANDGTVPFRTGERISFGFLVSQKFSGESAELCVLRDGKQQTVTVPLRVPTRLVPVHIAGKLPSFFIVAGLVFTPVTQPFLQSEYGAEFEYETPVKLLDRMLHGKARTDDEQIVVLSQVLAHDVNIGYEDITNSQVMKFNGEDILNLKQLAHLVDTCKATYLQFELEHAEIVVLEAEAAYAATEEILADHCIPSSRSVDLLEKPPSAETTEVEPIDVDAKINEIEANLKGSLVPVITSPMDVDMSIAVASAAEEKRGGKGISSRLKRREETQKQQD